MKRDFGGDFSKDVQINRFKLEEECELQPALYYFYAEQYATARSERDAAKDHLDLVLAESESGIRANPPPDVKVTEAAIKALLEQDAAVQKAKASFRQAQANVDLLYAATASLEHRKAELDNLVVLWTREYYSGVNKDAQTIRNRLNDKGGE